MLKAVQNLYTAAGVRELDRVAIESCAIGGYPLMIRAATAAFALLRLRWPRARTLLVLCGGGNNGGDGLVLARLAREAGLDAQVVLGCDPARYQGSAARAWEDFCASGGEPIAMPTAVNADVIVDALLGTGLDRPVGGALADLMGHVNGAGRPVLAVDIPSGIQADSGAVLGCAIQADMTVSFIGAKQGLYTGEGLRHAGMQCLDDLDVPATVYEHVPPAAWHPGRAEILRLLPRRAQHAHKGHSGRVVVIGGDYGMAGAARLAGEAALAMGAGLVTVATRPEHAAALAAARPELMAFPLESPARQLRGLLAGADAVVAGPGLGQGAWGRAVLRAVRHTTVPGVLDADGLNLLARSGDGLHVGAGYVITPHPGEAARLLQGESDDRFATAAALAARAGATVVLKGPGTVVRTHSASTYVVAGAEPVLATGGTGDVLSGVIGGLIARGLSPEDAAVAGTWLHARAASRAAAGRCSGLRAGDLAATLATLPELHGP